LPSTNGFSLVSEADEKNWRFPKSAAQELTHATGLVPKFGSLLAVKLVLSITFFSSYGRFSNYFAFNNGAGFSGYVDFGN